MSIKIRNLLTEDDEKYVDLSTLTAYGNANSDTCLTAVDCESPRMQLGKDLLEDIGSPEIVELFLTDKNVIVMKSRDDKSGYKVRKHNTIYCAEFTRQVMLIAGIDRGSGSTKCGSYHLQQYDENTVAAVISFD